MTAITRNEHQLLLASAQALHQIDIWQPSSLLHESLDWRYIYTEAIQHRIVPLLQYFLKKHTQFNVPQEILSSIDQYVHRQALANIFQTNELLRVLNRLQAEGIQAVPFKGPTLGMLLYNQLALRAFGDLDILIHRKDFYTIKHLLGEMGYTPFRKLSDKKEAAFLDTQMGYEFIREDERCVIEIHWSLLSRIHAFKIPDNELWGATKTIDIQNKLIPKLDDKHLFIYLCAHGTKSFWERIRWISDIAELISIKSMDSNADTWWSSLLKQASDYNSTRMVHLGVYLAHKLLHAPVPQSIIDDASRDRHVLFLYNRVLSALFAQPNQKKRVLKPISFHLHMRERFKDKQPYLGHIFKLWVLPSKKDKAFFKLPEPFSFLYIFVKPIRVLSQALQRRMP